MASRLSAWTMVAHLAGRGGATGTFMSALSAVPDRCYTCCASSCVIAVTARSMCSTV